MSDALLTTQLNKWVRKNCQAWGHIGFITKLQYDENGITEKPRTLIREEYQITGCSCNYNKDKIQFDTLQEMHNWLIQNQKSILKK